MLVDLAPYVVAGIAAVWVPWLTFRYATRQDQRRWWREQRAAVYVDMLVEAYAELQYLLYEITRLKMGDADAPKRRPTRSRRQPGNNRRIRLLSVFCCVAGGIRSADAR